MNRSDQIYEFVFYDTLKKIKSKNIDDIGLDALEISVDLKLQRSNISKELNKLWKDGLLGKINGRPTLFFPIELIKEAFPGINIPSFIEKNSSLKEILNANKPITHSPNNKYKVINPSHKKIISSLNYPSHAGIVLILGEYGCGKSRLVDKCLEYCLQNNILLQKESNISILDCYFIKSVLDDLTKIPPNNILILKNIHCLKDSNYEIIYQIVTTHFSRLTSNQFRFKSILLTSEVTNSVREKKLGKLISNNIFLKPYNEISPIEKIEIVNEILSKEAESINKNISVDINFFPLFSENKEVQNIYELTSLIKNIISDKLLYCMHYDLETMKIELLDIPSMYHNYESAYLSEFHDFFEKVNSSIVYYSKTGRSNLDFSSIYQMDVLDEFIEDLLLNISFDNIFQPELDFIMNLVTV